MKVTRRIHKVYAEWKQAKKRGIKISKLMGKYQYIYETEKGKISLIKLLNYWKEKQNLWEIYELSKNNLFEDTERFETKKEAKKRIREILK
ncbi:MAG TPA: hypothetical protein VMZ91_09475 [Candidatus Paceibacterota bacterium]|nr:hypothetical protein [Candidatus Paceibacterota bacterium]